MSSPTFDNNATGNTGAVPFTTSFTIGNNPNPAAIVALFVPPTATSNPSTPTLGGTNMTFLTDNAGPISTYGGIFIYYMLNAPTGSQTFSFNASTGANTWYAIFSYYHVKGIDTSAVTQGTYNSNLTLSLTAISNNTLMWGVGGATDNTGHFPQFGSGAPNNTNSNPSTNGSPRIYAGDYGVQSTPTSESFTVNPQAGGGGVAVISLVALLGPQTMTLVATQGSYSLTGESITLSKIHQYIISLVTGMYNLTGIASLLTYMPNPWTNQSKSASPTWGNQTKDSTPWTNQSKSL